MGHRIGPLVFLVLTLLAPVAAARPSLFPEAHSDGSSHGGRLTFNWSRARHDKGFLTFETFATRLSVPTMAVNGDNTPRNLVGLPASGGFATLYGGGLGVTMRSDYLTWQLFHFRYAVSGDRPVAAIARANGESVTVDPGPLHVLHIAFPIVQLPGFQIFAGSSKVAVQPIEWGMTHRWSVATLRDAGGSFDGDVDAWTPYVRSEMGICFDGGTTTEVTRLWPCLTIAADLYDGNAGWLKGTSLGLRVEL